MIVIFIIELPNIIYMYALSVSMFKKKYSTISLYNNRIVLIYKYIAFYHQLEGNLVQVMFLYLWCEFSIFINKNCTISILTDYLQQQ